MSRYNSDSKPKSANEIKNIPARRLFRGVMEYARRLENGRQHRRNLMSVFQSEQIGLRHKLRDACEKLMFTYPVEYGRKAEELIWRKVYYEVIQLVKGNKKFVKAGSRLELLYKEYLLSAVGYYHHLLLKLQANYHPTVDVDWPFTISPLSEKSNRKHQDKEDKRIDGDIVTKKEEKKQDGSLSMKTKDQEDSWNLLSDWAQDTCYRLLLCLGDLGRYQMEHGGSRSFAERFYQLALLVKPDTGMPFNQLGTLAGHHTWWGLTAAYYYYRCLETENKFDGADGNLQKLLDRNKKSFYQIPTVALENLINAEDYRKEHTRIFIVSFLYLCDLLRPKTYATDVEITGLCKKLIDALPVCLAHSAVSKDKEPHEESKDIEMLDKENSRASTKRNHIPHHHHHHHATGDFTRIQPHIVLKMCVLCIINIHNLQSSRSNRSSAAIAFALAFFSHLLGHVISQLCPDKSREAVTNLEFSAHSGSQESKEEGENGATHQNGDGDACHIRCKENVPGKKRRNRMMRRRRHRGSGDSDLSEGEVMSRSDVSDSENDSDGSESSSATSGNSELSQEEMNDVINAGSKTKNSEVDGTNSTSKKAIETHSAKIVDNHAGLELANSLANGQSTLASLKDISQKMFQPTVRRRILLAPSFFNNIPKPQPPAKFPEATQKAEEADHEPKESQTSVKAETGEKGDDKEEPKPESAASDDKVSDGMAESEKKAGEMETDAIAPLDLAESAIGPAKTELCHSNRSTPVDEVNGVGERVIVTAEFKVKVFHQMASMHQCFAALKLLCDWLAANEKVTAACAQNSKALWSRIARLANLLPDEDDLLQIDDVASDEMLQAQVKILKSSISSAKKWRQKARLPEDYVLSKATSSLLLADDKDDKIQSLVCDLTDTQQNAIRICRIRTLCHSLARVSGLDLEYNDTTKRFEGPEEPSEEDADHLDIETMEEMRKNRLMKDMAELRLRNEVSTLESQLGTPRTRDASLCLYLIPDALALCHDLPHIRRLLSSERFFIVIPKTVIDGLDGFKKDLQGARDAIRFLETEFKKGNRFIKAQTAEETTRGVYGERPKLRRNDMQAWRFYRIIECCRYITLEKAKENGEHSETSGIIAILTHSTDKATLSQNQINAINAAESLGIQVFSAAQFSKLWKKLPSETN